MRKREPAVPASNSDLFNSCKNTLATGVPQEMPGLREKAQSQRGLFCQQSLCGRERKGLLTHQTRGLGNLNGLKRKLKGNKGGWPVTSVTLVSGTHHLFSDRARAGSVPTASPALSEHLAASFTTSQSKVGLLCLRGWGASLKKQCSLIIKHCRWTPPASFGSTNNNRMLTVHKVLYSNSLS